MDAKTLKICSYNDFYAFAAFHSISMEIYLFIMSWILKMSACHTQQLSIFSSWSQLNHSTYVCICLRDKKNYFRKFSSHERFFGIDLNFSFTHHTRKHFLNNINFPMSLNFHFIYSFNPPLFLADTTWGDAELIVLSNIDTQLIQFLVHVEDLMTYIPSRAQEVLSKCRVTLPSVQDIFFLRIIFHQLTDDDGFIWPPKN